MKILYSADLHIKIGQKNVPKEWQKARYRMLFKELEEIALDSENEVDLIILGGDIFDAAPNLQEIELYFELLTHLPVRTIIYDGNHEATKKGQTFFKELKKLSEKVNNNVEVILKEQTIEFKDGTKIDFIPYTELHRINKKDKFESLTSDILCTHVRGEIPPHVKPEVDLDFFDRWETVLAGDLHSYTNCQRNIIYPGSPLTTSFHRNEVDTGVIIFDTETHQHEWVKLNLPQLLKVTVDSEEDIVATDFHHTVYVLENSEIGVAGANRNNELVDKVVVKKDYTSTLNLKDKSIAEELSIYLSKVQKLTQNEISDIMGVFNAFYKKAGME